MWWNHAPIVAFDAEDLVVAETRAALEDNRAKLAKSGLEDRHLFVWINVWELGANAAFAVGMPPPRPPSLPDEVTELWIGRLGESSVQVWRFADGRWTHHEISAESGS